MQNKAADALSRKDQTVELNTMTTTGIVDLELIEKEVENDKELQEIIAEVKGGGPGREISMD